MGEKGIAVGISRLVRGTICPLFGAALLWSYLRYQSFVMDVFPAGLVVPLGREGLSAHIAYLGMLALLALAMLFGWRRISSLLDRRRVLCAGACAMGSIGVALAFLVQKGIVGAALLWPSTACVAFGFLANYLMWATTFASSFNARQIVLLATSYFVSIALGPVSSGSSNEAIAATYMTLIPLLSGILWACTKLPDDEGQGQDAPDTVTGRKDLSINPSPRAASFGIRQLGNPLVWLFSSFLLAGSAVRGVVDLYDPAGTSLRHDLSIVVTILLILASLAFWLRERNKRSEPSERFGERVVRLVIVMWIAVAVVFVVGLFLFLTMTNQKPGGDVVVMARTMLELLFWILLCNLARERRIAAIPLFLSCGMLVEIASWVVSYALIPLLLGGGSGIGGLSSNALVLALAFGLIGAATVACGCWVAFRERGVLAAMTYGECETRARDTLGAADATETSSTAGIGALTVGTHASVNAAGLSPDGSDRTVSNRDREILEDVYGLTQREAHVALLFSQGYSLNKVSQMLAISPGTAQGYIKGAYRKLDVHSKDELIELIATLG